LLRLRLATTEKVIFRTAVSTHRTGNQKRKCIEVSKLTEKIKAAAALSYDPEKDSAPQVVAAGRGRLAELIENTARENKVPVYRNEPLALTLTGLGAGREIPPELYQAVAEIIAWVYTTELKLKNA